jgi:hypothetical protein
LRGSWHNALAVLVSFSSVCRRLSGASVQPF